MPVKTYKSMNEDVAMMMESLKIRGKMKDSDIAGILGIAPATLRNYRSQGTLPNMPFCRIMELAQCAGYEVKIEKRR